MKTLIITSILMASLTAFSYSKPINEIYSIKEPVQTNESYVNANPINAFEVLVDTNEVKTQDATYNGEINYGSRTTDYHKKALKSENAGSSKINPAGSTDNEFESRLNDYYKNKPNDGNSSKNEFIISDEDQGSPFYVTVKLATPSKTATK